MNLIRNLSLNNHVIVNIVAISAFSIALSIDAGISNKFNIPLYIGITLALPALFIASIEKKNLNKIKTELSRLSISDVIITGLAWFLFIFFTLLPFKNGDVSKTILISSSIVVLNTIVASVVHKEKEGFLQKLLASILVVAGVYFTLLS